MALLPRRTSLAAVLAIGAAVLQPALAGQAFGAAALGTPTGLAPTSGSTPLKNPVLSWSTVSGASSYDVELSKSDDWSDSSEFVTLPDSGDTPTTSYAVPQTLIHGVYFWRVQALSATSKSTWSTAKAEVDKAWADAPSVNGSTPSSDPTVAQTGIASYPWRFAWKPMPDASSYEVEFSTLPTFPQPDPAQTDKSDTSATSECLTTSTSYTPYSSSSGLKDIGVDNCSYTMPASGSVYWRVRGVDDSNTKAVAPASTTESLECAGIPSDADNSSTTVLALGTPTSKGQECSLWSDTETVPVALLPAGSGVPAGTVSGMSLGCPAGTGTDFECTTSPEISWQPTANAAEYQVTIADDSAFTNIERSYTTPFLSLTPRDQLADYTAGKGYYVAVQACNPDPNSTQASPLPAKCGTATIKTFTKQSPTVTGLKTAKVPGGFRLSWNDYSSNFETTPAGTPAVQPENYVVELTKSSDTDFDSVTSKTIVDASCDSTVDTTCYLANGLQTGGDDQVVVTPPKTGNYIWRVIPVDLSGNTLPASNTGASFAVDKTAPVLTISTKNGVAVGGPLTITSSETVTGVSSSTVKVVPSGKPVADAVAGKIAKASAANTWTFTPSAPLATGGTYVLDVSGVFDTSGNLAVVGGTGVETTKVAKDTSAGWSFGSGWKKVTATSALSGSYRTAAAGKKATLSVMGAQAVLFGCKAPSMGKITVTVGGVSTTVSEHGTFTQCGVQLWSGPLSGAPQTLEVKVTKGHGNVDEVSVS